MAAKERAIRRPIFGIGLRRSTSLFALASVFGLTLPAGRIEAQQPPQRPAPWSGGIVAPPAAILGLTDASPIMPLEFSRAWLAKVEAVQLRREELASSGGLDGVSPLQLALAGAALTGRLRIPVIPVRYSDVREPFSEQELERRLFGASTGDTVSFSDYWREVSGGLLTVEGRVANWLTARRNAHYYLPAEQHGWSSFGRIGELRDEAFAHADAHLDFAEFDNDGPDGIPNSGDDDGFVDFVAIVYAVACPGDGRAGAIWPHRAAMPPYETRTIGADGKPIRIADYVVLPVVDAETCGPMPIGVLAHETGHALGLPDLYDYDGTSQGIGAWGLMGTGSHAAQHSPAHPSAWEKEQLGWVKVSWITRADSAMTFQPVQRAHTVYRFDGARGEYLLLENRQQTGSDSYLPGSGLLIWQVDPERGELGAWNNDEGRAALQLIQADGRNDLAQRALRADAGDPFPGRSRRGWFVSYLAGGLQLTNIRVTGEDVRAHVIAGSAYPALIPAHDVLRMTTLAGGSAVQQSIDVRRAGAVEYDWQPVTDAPWLRVERIGETVKFTAHPAGLEPGQHADTISLMADTLTLARVVVSFYLATPGVAEKVADDLPWSWGVAVHGGRVLQASYGWDQLGLRPRPRVLQLWEAATHPHTLTRIAADALYSPIVDQRDGAAFVLSRARDGNYLYQLRPNGDAHLIAARIGTEPAYGAAVLPNGDIAVAQWDGAITRVTRAGAAYPFVHAGEHIYQIASDSAGTIYAATFAGHVLRIGSDGTLHSIETGFGEGRLVTVTITPAGDVIAAERGGQGRIVRFRADGTRDTVYISPGSRFYGLAVDGAFLYALRERQLLRMPLPAQAQPAVVSPATSKR
ncbi:MAG TPA: M6 family metalloprotease domain-containing protein [Longimicrobiales bacterium]|nr:M6 family metalloprotease domain-containing protein [Longimicrobiales bacterium]